MSKTEMPSIRFYGFEDAWEQRKLKEIYGSIGNAFVGTATPYYVERGHFYLESNNVKDGWINHNSEIFVNDEFYEKQKDKWLHAGDMVMVQSGHVGHAAVIPEELDNTAAHALIMFRNPKEKIEPYFLNYEYQTNKAKKKIENITTGNTIKHILASDMQEFVVDVPKYEEQQAIADYFRNLDHLISLHQRKFEKLTNVKKSMLGKMFPRNGSCYPEIRFKGFTGPWEQRKLGDVVKEITRNDPESEAPIMMITANNGFIEQSERYAFNNAGESLKKYILLKKGELAYNHGASKLRPYGSCFALTTAENARIPFVYHCFSAENQNAEFMSIELNGAEIENQLRKIVSSGARMDGLLNISFDEYTSVSVLLPGTEEQDRIAEFFRHLDHLITLHQRELEKLQSIKKALLEKMFV